MPEQPEYPEPTVTVHDSSSAVYLGGGASYALEPTLTDFLSARIAEDEALARSGFSHPDRWVKVAPTGIPNGLSCSAVLAECAAKRAIIAECAAQPEWDDHAASHTPEGWTVVARQALAKHVLLALAQPYANHPDLQPEWRQ